MKYQKPTLEDLWREAHFIPNDQQRRAIKYTKGPLFLKAGPGSGKTKVLLWRTLHLVVHHDVSPEDIFLATFTEKAALQLQEGLRALMEYATEVMKRTIDLSNMYVGTIHSLCHRMIRDRRFSPGRRRPKSPLLLDELEQYLFLYNPRRWRELTSGAGWKNANTEINEYLSGRGSVSRHLAVSNCISLFNRFSEECINPERLRIRSIHPTLRKLMGLYKEYREALQMGNPAQTDFSLLQQAGLDVLEELDKRSGKALSGKIFKHVIIDEYQDTNTIQEKLVFRLAAGHKNICVVGDDDQALYRFRGATVENFVEFPKRCSRYLGTAPKEIALATNYRSRRKILKFYSNFMTHQTCDWSKGARRKESYRVAKNLVADRKDDGTSVVMSEPNDRESVCNEIAGLAKRIIELKEVEDPNQIAFLFPTLKSKNVQSMIAALESKGLKVYAPRAKTFLDVEEATAVVGLLLQIFGKPSREDHWGSDFKKYMDWLDRSSKIAKKLLNADASLKRYIEARRNEIEAVVRDYKILKNMMERQGWDGKETYDPSVMGSALENAAGLSKAARRTIASRYLGELVQRRINAGRPFTLGYIVRRATSFDWNLLDLFYRFCGFRHFRKMFDLAQNVRKDEGPICNMSLLSHYLSRYLDYQNISIFDARLLSEDAFKRSFFLGYLYALYRRGESEYEDAEDPFPRGRIPFLTIHQAKGLEFPVVILGSARKNNRRPQRIEEVVQPLIKGRCEPLDKMPIFDVMRMFYVALSRAKNLLVIAYYRGRGHTINEPFKSMLNENFPRINQLRVTSLPRAEVKKDDLPRTYSYTGDFLHYKRCPRQYMIFRKYGFAPARSLTMFFGSLVHETIEDLHQHLLEKRQIHGQKATPDQW